MSLLVRQLPPLPGGLVDSSLIMTVIDGGDLYSGTDTLVSDGDALYSSEGGSNEAYKIPASSLEPFLHTAGQSMIRYYLAAPQSIVSGIWTTVMFAQKDIDRGNEWSSSTYTFNCQPGIYYLGVSVRSGAENWVPNDLFAIRVVRSAGSDYGTQQAYLNDNVGYLGRMSVGIAMVFYTSVPFSIQTRCTQGTTLSENVYDTNISSYRIS